MHFHSLLFVALCHFTLGADPGLPVDDPNISFWQLPPNADVADLQSANLPTDVDVVIIGSGVTGTAVARWLLRDGSKTQPLRIAMVEARQACSGATGRNAGQVRPNSWEYYNDEQAVGPSDAAKIAKLKAGQWLAYAEAADEDLDEVGRDAAEVRSMDSIDAWFTEESFNTALSGLEYLKQKVPEVGNEWTAISGDEARQKTLMPDAYGIFVGTEKTGGTMWPYRFVTYMQSALLKNHPSFSLDTNTPVLSVTSSSTGNGTGFEVKTSRGVIRSRHVVHAENAWIPHLVKGLDTKITQARWHMSAQAVGDKIPDAGAWPAVIGNSSSPGGRGMALWRDNYATFQQQPKSGLFIAGGGVAGQGDQVPAWDDHTAVEPVIASYLNGFLPTYFGYDNWGAERPASEPKPHVYPGRAKALWTGVDSISWDAHPIVGALPTSTTGREAKGGAEWICSGYDGDGMASAWLSAKALSTAILSFERNSTNQIWPEWFPDSWVVSAERLSKPAINSTRTS